MNVPVQSAAWAGFETGSLNLPMALRVTTGG
jgi:hypothetical protein